MEFLSIYPSPVGTLLLTARDSGLTGLWLDPSHCPRTGLTQNDSHPVFVPVRDWLDGYFRGDAPSIGALPLYPSGTEFQMQVWEILRRIPYGETVTYGDIAKEMAQIRGKQKMSAQAVGQAVGANPISIIVPCHRCLGAGGKLTGYGGGLDKKIWLLRHEGWLQEGEI